MALLSFQLRCLLSPWPLYLGETASERELIFPHAFIGLLAVTVNTAAAPIERVHLLIQNQNEMIKSGCLSTPYKGMKDCFLRTIKQEGLISLWRGNSMNVLKVFTSQALAFAIMKNSWHNEAHVLPLMSKLPEELISPWTLLVRILIRKFGQGSTVVCLTCTARLLEGMALLDSTEDTT